MRKTKAKQKREQGITLIALVITIIILIILATVTITLVFGEGGLIQRAQESKRLTDQAQKDEQDELKGAEEYINGVLAGTGTINPPEEKSEVEEARDSGTPFEDTTTITDDLDNPIKVPGGFNIAEDSGTKIEEGIVIEDSNGNQFVWIPVGEYNVSTTINSTGELTNELTRRTFTSTGSTPVSGDNVIEEYFYGEGNENSVAKNQIDNFKESATINKGFYIGRYEAGTKEKRTSEEDLLTIPIVQANKYAYNYVTRDEAKQQAEAMYEGNKYVTSELISSYAWDTALNFICQTNEEGYILATTDDNIYGNIRTSNPTKTGEYKVNEKAADKYSNLYDILGNYYEWTSEYSNEIKTDIKRPCVCRGGSYYNSISYPSATRRGSDTIGNLYDRNAFRIQIYIRNDT